MYSQINQLKLQAVLCQLCQKLKLCNISDYICNKWITIDLSKKYDIQHSV